MVSEASWEEIKTETSAQTIQVDGIGEMTRTMTKAKAKKEKEKETVKPQSDEEEITKKKEKKKPLSTKDQQSALGPDVRDPRYLGAGPCGTEHLQFYQGANKWGIWHHCSRCDLRLQYFTRSGAPGGATKTHLPARVNEAIQLLKDAEMLEKATHKEMRAAIKIAEQAQHLSLAKNFMEYIRTLMAEKLREMIREQSGEAPEKLRKGAKERSSAQPQQSNSSSAQPRASKD